MGVTRVCVHDSSTPPPLLLSMLRRIHAANSVLVTQWALCTMVFFAFLFLAFPLHLRLQHMSSSYMGASLSSAATAHHDLHTESAGMSLPKRRLADVKNEAPAGHTAAAAHVSENVAEIASLLHALEINGVDEGPSSMMVVTGQSHGGECPTTLGLHFLTKAYKNKVDYCNLHDCTVRYILETWGEDSNGAPANTLLRLMQSNPSVEWFMWMDTEAMFTNLSFAFPLQTYKAWGKHFIIPGSAANKAPGGMEEWSAVNPLIFLVRNCEWSAGFLREWRVKSMQRSMKEALHKDQAAVTPTNDEGVQEAKYESSDYDKETLVHLLRGSKAEITQGKVFVEDGYYLHGRGDFIVESYEKVVAEGIEAKKQKWPFVVHFRGCNFCGSNVVSGTCLAGFQRAFYFADNQLVALAGLQHRHLYSTLA